MCSFSTLLSNILYISNFYLCIELCLECENGPNNQLCENGSTPEGFIAHGNCACKCSFGYEGDTCAEMSGKLTSLFLYIDIVEYFKQTTFHPTNTGIRR